MSRAFQREGVERETEVELAENLWAISIDPNLALAGVALQAARRRRAGARCWRARSAFQYFVAAAPGAQEMITIAKVFELAQLERWDRRNRTYDLVIVDAPASGHGLAMLSTPRTFGEIARVGPIKRQAEKISRLLGDPTRTGYLAVALAEEMPVNETLELGAPARGRGRARARRGDGQRALPRALHEGRGATMLRSAAEERARAGGARRRPGRAGRARARAGAAARTCKRLRKEAGAPVLELPLLFEPQVGLDEYQYLAGWLDATLAPPTED